MKKISFCLAVLILSMSILSGLATAQRSPVPVMGLFIDQNTMTLTVGSFGDLSGTITPANATNNWINWTSTRPDVATVFPVRTRDSVGIVRINAIAPGETVITAITEDGRYTATCVVTVRGASPAPTPTPTPIPTPRTGGATIVTAWMALGMLGAGFAFKRLKR